MDKKKILLVDDEADFLELIGIRIKGWGYDLIRASNAKEAIEAVMSKNPDIVILDYMMPDMDGVTLFKKIREINRNISVVMFTAYPEPKAMKVAGELGVKAFVPKLSTFADASSNLKSVISMIEKELNKRE